MGVMRRACDNNQRTGADAIGGSASAGPQNGQNLNEDDEQSSVKSRAGPLANASII